MSLVDHYKMTNAEGGHSESCAWGAGGDCSCGVIEPCFYQGCEEDEEGNCVYCSDEGKARAEQWAKEREEEAKLWRDEKLAELLADDIPF